MRPLLRLIGILVHIPAVMAATSLLVAGFRFNQNENLALLVTGTFSLILGQLTFRCGVKMERNNKHLATPAVAISWFVVPWLSAFPFWLIGKWDPAAAQGLGDFASGLFESMSGLTSCGLTVCADTSQLSPMLQWWRSLSQWVGGLGMAVFALLLIVPQEDGEAFLGAEGLSQTFGDTPQKTVFYIAQFYAGFTIMAMLLFWLTGMPIWEAINHGLTVISTGGFTMNGAGFQAYHRSSQWVAIVFMVLGAISFRIYYLLIVKRNLRRIWQSSEMRLYALILLVGGGLSISGLSLTLSEGSFSDLAFQWASAAGTCGFASVEISDWGSASLMILIAVMFVGGMTGSTAGGIKVTRALGGVGLSTGVLSSGSAEDVQWLFILLMWLGRLEIFTVIGLFFLGGSKFMSVFRRSDRA